MSYNNKLEMSNNSILDSFKRSIRDITSPKVNRRDSAVSQNSVTPSTKHNNNIHEEAQVSLFD